MGMGETAYLGNRYEHKKLFLCAPITAHFGLTPKAHYILILVILLSHILWLVWSLSFLYTIIIRLWYIILKCIWLKYLLIYNGSVTFFSVVIEANLSVVTINQCDKLDESNAFNGTHKCHSSTDCAYKAGNRPFAAGNYWCLCKPGYYSEHSKFDGTLVEGDYSVTRQRCPTRGPRPFLIRPNNQNQRANLRIMWNKTILSSWILFQKQILIFSLLTYINDKQTK